MTEAEAHEAILQRWLTGWDELHGSLTLDPIDWVPSNEIRDAADEWVRIALVPAVSRQTTLGTSPRWTREGNIAVQIFTMSNTGTKRASELADDVRTVLEGRFIEVVGDHVVTSAGSSSPGGADGKWFITLVTVPYRFDEIRQ